MSRLLRSLGERGSEKLECSGLQSGDGERGFSDGSERGDTLSGGPEGSTAASDVGAERGEVGADRGEGGADSGEGGADGGEGGADRGEGGAESGEGGAGDSAFGSAGDSAGDSESF